MGRQIFPAKSRDKFALGIDYGTGSGRVAVVRVANGELVSSVIIPYPDGVIDMRLPGGPKLARDWALQNPRDYLQVMEKGVPKALKAAGVKSEQVIGLGTDFTASSPLPVKRDGTPLCFLPKFRKQPHAWVKLWKHHSAQPEADRINEIGRERNEDFIRTYGGKYSSEWFFSKLLQIVNESPAIYDATERFVESADWIVWQLTGEEKRSTCTAGYKAMWVKGRGFPSSDFFRALHPSLENVIGTKISEEYFPLGARAGGMTAEWARKTGLREGIPISVGNVDAHVSAPACAVTEPGSMVMIMGTSICHILLGRERQMVEGMCGVVEDGVVPGLWGYEAGQSAVGDIFAWFFENGVHESVLREARKSKVPFTTILEKHAAALAPGESGLLALDWWNGNRSVLVDAGLTGVLLGLRLATKPEEIYRALIEATAFGTRQIIEAFESRGIEVRNLVACGGLPEKNRLLMQIYSDVTGREIRIARQMLTCPALGSAMHGAVAAGRGAGGYDTIFEAAQSMAHLQNDSYRPRKKAHEVYNTIFKEYQTLHDYFGRGANEVMKRLKALQSEKVFQ
ncbi:MAG: ribulokinase [Acidobacteria bacterium]|nr:MAG: ribulokinase [Acidobacteriota bacterium]